MKNELYDIISGKKQVSFGAALQAIAHYLRESQNASGKTEHQKLFKKQETARLEEYISHHHLWVDGLDLSQYVSEGAEQKVYLKDETSVFKLNDAIYYTSWKDYFHNLLLHNYFFPDTAYQLMGFTIENSILYAVVKQRFVTSTDTTNLMHVRTFLSSNGFENTRNNDYYHPDLGIILEDLHDENVLTQNGILYFIDTVFYLTDTFWVNEK